MKDVIRKEHFFAHSIKTVWEAISKEEKLSTWFVKADFKAEKGYKYTFSSDDEDCKDIMGEVKHAEPYTLIYSWIVEGTDVETIVKWELTETNDGTKLLLEHSGISNYAKDSAVTFFSNFESGWNKCINDLQSYLPKEAHAR
ncbi:hypothetical protein HME9304_03131 [Flagellimonas maritima]|uniref:Activator of Hsp90 ATPase homologue 1/2-like C-terminal domain-containing protein n=1 Tax=Flagellimonas maritima TaxID=1383885 RepID=A0A2Z4LWI1_9FLAO|nr:SRPBCC domain-containing protein [Allomuricauda aurantiaca]AWX46099.1 hypothetical protein HME9304_03131 [Allomuricauda aurantiaca]